jgi:ParB-like chromosome segregation protein Spo0J
MRVKVKNLMPNPFRHLESYPISQEKVADLVRKIKKTGFWDNVLARKKGDKFEIAYGHHRLEALKKSGTTEVDIPVKDLDDATMLRIMADENDDLYNMTPAVLSETVKQVKDYLESIGKKSLRSDIQKFLGWEDSRKIEHALAALDDIEDERVDKEAYETLPTIEQAKEFRRAIKQANGKISVEKQRSLAKKLVKDGVGSRDIKKEVIHEAYHQEKEKPSMMEFIYKELRPLIGKLYVRLEEVNKQKKHIERSAAAYVFFSECAKLQKLLDMLLDSAPITKVIEDEKLQLTHKEAVNV